VGRDDSRIHDGENSRGDAETLKLFNGSLGEANEEDLYHPRRVAVFPTVFADRGSVEIAVQGTGGIGSADHGSVNDRVIIGVGRHDAGGRAREHNLRDVLRSKIDQKFGNLFIGEFRRNSNPLIIEDSLQLPQEEWRQEQRMIR
jgi:hypothetical protein